jgi:chitodextrinase
MLDSRHHRGLFANPLAEGLAMPARRLLAFQCCVLFSALLLTACGGDDGGGPVTPPPPPKTPLAVDDLRVTAGAAGEVTLAWTSPALADKAGYAVTYDLRHVAYGNEALDWTLWTPLAAPAGDAEPGTARTHTVTGLTPDAVYAFGLVAGNGEDNASDRSNVAVGTAAPGHDTTPPEAVTDLAQVGGTRTSLTVRWSTVGGDGAHGHAPHYQVRYSTSPITEENWDQATFEGDLSITPATSLSHTITGLAAETEYWVAVKASDDAGNTSAVSNVPQLTTVDLRVIEVFVDGSGDYRTIEEALVGAKAGDLILVGPGRYTWTNQGTGDAETGLIWVPARKDSVEMRSTHGAELTIIDGEEIGPILHINGGTVDPPGGERYWTGITVDGFTFTGGVADYGETGLTAGGGAISAHLSDSVIRNCIFTGNRANEGGAVWVGGQGAAVLENCLFYGNDANSGGGVFLINSEPTITVRNCEIRDNHATFYGGGLVAAHCSFVLEDCLITGNDSNAGGGGLYVVEITDDDPDVYLRGRMTGVTVADNDSPLGSGLYLENMPDFKIERMIVAYNTGSAGIKSVKMGGGLRVGCTLLYGHLAGARWPQGFTDLGGNIEAKPEFCDRTDYWLRSDSPALAACGQIGARAVGCTP